MFLWFDRLGEPYCSVSIEKSIKSRTLKVSLD